MDTYKPRKTALVCRHPNCVRLTRRYNGLCVRHRNNQELVQVFRLKQVVFQNWKESLQPIFEDEVFGDWEIIQENSY